MGRNQNNRGKKMRKQIKELFVIVCVLTIWLIILTVNVSYGLSTQKSDKTELTQTTAKTIEYVKPTQTPTATPTSMPVRTEMYVATAYCSCSRCCGKSDGITATGTKAKAGRTIAVDPKKIPLGSKVIIDGNEYIAEDVGGAIKGNKVDIYFDSHSEALKFGRKTVKLTIIENNGV